MDNRNPPPTNENVSKSMRSNKGKGTKPELEVRKILRELGYPGYRLNWKKAPGRPDIAYPGRKIAIFVNGCFWHHCPVCNLPLPKSHAEFWKEKIERNTARDEYIKLKLANTGWTVVVIWECEIKNNRFKIQSTLKDLLERSPQLLESLRRTLNLRNQ